MLTVPKPLFPKGGAARATQPDRPCPDLHSPMANDPADDVNALVGLWYAILIELGIALVVLLLLLFWLF
jgi:hypothetical protein